jgi:hypothetical protein
MFFSNNRVPVVRSTFFGTITLFACFLVGCDRIAERQSAAHTSAETHGKLVALLNSCDLVLMDAELLMPSGTTNGASAALSSLVKKRILATYRESLPAPGIGSEIFDNWGTAIELTFSFERFITNGVGKVQARLRATTRSYGPNRRKETTDGDDLVIDAEKIVPAWSFSNVPIAVLQPAPSDH